MQLLEQAILQSLKDAGVTSPPVSLDLLLKHLGLDDLFWDFSCPEEKGSSLFWDEKKNKWRIRLSPLLPRNRLPFDLAHECVEFIALNAKLEVPHFKVNEGAAQLLMPTLWVQGTIQQKGFDLFAVKRVFSTASLDTCALRMVTLSQRPCFLFTCRPSPRNEGTKFSPARIVGRFLVSCQGTSHGLKKRVIDEKETTFLLEACSSLFPLVKNGEGGVLKAYPVVDNRGTRIKKLFLFSLPQGE